LSHQFMAEFPATIMILVTRQSQIAPKRLVLRARFDDYIQQRSREFNVRIDYDGYRQARSSSGSRNCET
jgi:hypothetical protein